MKTPQAIERLETRIAPASLLSPATVTYQDVDGDDVTVKFSKPILTSLTIANNVFEFDPNPITDGPGGNGAPQQLQLIDLTALPNINDATGMTITITAKRSAVNGGDGFASVGAINADGINLGAVSVDGDLGQIDAGLLANTDTTAGLKALTVQSMGEFDLSTQVGGDLVSEIRGALPSLVVKGDLRGEHINVSGNVGTAKIAGSLIGNTVGQSGTLEANKFTSVTIGGDLVGGSGAGSGSVNGAADTIVVGGSLFGSDVATASIEGEKVTVHGDVIGGNFDDGGQILVRLGGKLTLDGDLRGGAGQRTGKVYLDTGSAMIGGDVIGGTGAESGAFEVAGFANSKSAITIAGSLIGKSANTGMVQVLTGAAISTLKIGRDLIGGNGADSGIIKTAPGSDIGTITIGGNVLGGLASDSGAIITGGGNAMDQGSDIGTLSIGGDFAGSTIIGSGHIFVSGKLTTLKIGGSVIGGSNDNAGKLETTDAIDSITIGGSIKGGTSSGSGVVQSGKDMGTVLIKHDLVGDGIRSGRLISGGIMKSVTVNGSVIGGSGDFSGRILSTGDLVSLTVGHDIRSGAGNLSGSVASTKAIGTMLVKGSLIGTDTSKARILALESSAPTDTTNVAIGKLTVNGRVEFAQILAGYFNDATPGNVDAQIGTVTVGRDWVASDLVAGAIDGGDGFGDGTDSAIPPANDPTNDANTFSRIASIVIKGHALGTVGGPDHFGFVAQQLGSLKIGDATFLFSDAVASENKPVGSTGDLNAREV